MAYTIEQYDALKKAIAGGSHSVSYGDKSVTYRSLAEMKAILTIMEDELFPERRPRRRHLASFDRGYFPNTIDNEAIWF